MSDIVKQAHQHGVISVIRTQSDVLWDGRYSSSPIDSKVLKRMRGDINTTRKNCDHLEALLNNHDELTKPRS